MSADLRFGDLSCTLLGINDLRPFIEITFQSQKRRSSPVHAKRGTAIFGWSTCFTLNGEDRNCVFRMYDKRGAQSALRGDPLIGSAVLPLVERLPSEGLVASFTLRKGRASTGQLTVHYELLPSKDAQLTPGRVLLGTAFGDVLCAGGADGLLPCRTLPAAAGFLAARHGGLNAAGAAGAAGLRSPDSGSDGSLDDRLSESGLARSDSCGSFCSALEDPEDAREAQAEAAGGPAGRLQPPSGLQLHRRCEAAAEAYVHARMRNDVALLRSLLADTAVVAVPRGPLGGTTAHQGWGEVEAYLLANPARADCFRAWAHARTEVGGPCEGSPETTVVQWTGQVYKLGGWRRVRSNFIVDNSARIRRVDVARA